MTCLTCESNSCSCVQMQFRTYQSDGSSIGSGSIWSLSHSFPFSCVLVVDDGSGDDDENVGVDIGL